MTTWAEFCAGSGKDSQAILSWRLRVPVGPQLVREGGCCIAKCSLYAVGIPSCFPRDFPGDAEKGWNGSLTHAFLFWSSQGLRLGMRGKGWLIWELRKAIISVLWDSRCDATRGADNAARSRAALVFYFSSPPPGKRSVNMPGCINNPSSPKCYPEPDQLLRLGPAVIWLWVCLLPPVR